MAFRPGQFGPVQFWLGLCIGLVVAFLVSSLNLLATQPSTSVRLSQSEHILRHLHPQSHDDLEPHGDLDKGPLKTLNFADTHLHHDDDTIARKLSERVRVLCWVMTAPQNLAKKAKAVKETWAKRCNKVIFFSSKSDPNFPTVGLNTSEGREHLTAKTMQAFRYVYENHINDYDWFMKVDDDTYVIVENLRYFLSGEDKEAPMFFGHHFKVIVEQGYYSGGGGYVLSKEALRRYYSHGANTSLCRADGGAEDVEFGRCMQNLGVKTSNSTDAMGRSRFHCFNPETHLFGGYPDWYYKYDANGAKKGEESISDYAITFHYVGPEQMYALEFYVYHLRPYGIISGSQTLNKVHPT